VDGYYGGYALVGVVILVGVLFVTVALTANRLLSPSVPSWGKGLTYECGVDPVGEGWAQSHIRYYVFAYLYVVFAVDAIYLFPWATVIRDADLGRASLVEMGIFIGVIVLGLAHAGRRGLLRWV
jgi:NADH-quinone oxidoreductase subunit A